MATAGVTSWIKRGAGGQLSAQCGLRASRKASQQREELCASSWAHSGQRGVDKNSSESSICAAVSGWGHNIRETSSDS